MRMISPAAASAISVQACRRLPVEGRGLLTASVRDGGKRSDIDHFLCIEVAIAMVDGCLRNTRADAGSPGDGEELTTRSCGRESSGQKKLEFPVPWRACEPRWNCQARA